jgi:hypothetical protein
MHVLERLTTRYDPNEDRMQITGVADDGQTLTLWLTQRLLNRLVLHLCSSLEQPNQQPGNSLNSSVTSLSLPVRNHLEQSFAQQRARSALSVQPPVVPVADAPQWRVDSVDIKQGSGRVHLVLKGAIDGQQALLPLPLPVLRQWLGVVFEQYRQGGWPMQVWPAWMEEAHRPPAAPGHTVVH